MEQSCTAGDGLVSVLIGEKCEWVCCTRAVRVSVHSGHIVRICPVSLSGVVENRKTEKPNTAPHAGRERAMSQSVNATLEALVSTYLKPWSTAGVSLAAIDHAHHNFADYRDRSWGAYVPPGQSNNRLLRINILSNTLYYYTCAGSKSTRRLARQEAVLRLLRFTLDRYRLPDIDLVLSVSDRPTVPKALVARSGGINGANAPPPVFAYAITPKHYALPFPPVSFDPLRWPPLHARMGSHPPLSSRRPTALWRGSCNSLCDMMRGRKCEWPKDQRLLSRQQLLRQAERCPALCDVGITSSHKNCQGFASKRSVPMFCQSSKAMCHANHAFLVHVDGNGFSGRLDELLTLGGVILKQHSPFSAYYYPLLQPHVHYAPVHRNLSDLCARTRSLAAGLSAGGRRAPGTSAESAASDGAASDSSHAEDLAEGAAAFASRYLNMESVSFYLARLLSGYAKLQRFTPARHPQAVEWPGSTSSRPQQQRSSTSVAATVSGKKQCSSAACCKRHPKASGCAG